MVEYIVIFESTVTVVVKIHADLFARMNTISAQNRRATGRDPYSGQRISVNFVFFDDPLAFFVNVNASVLAVVDFIITYDRIAVGSNLDTG